MVDRTTYHKIRAKPSQNERELVKYYEIQWLTYKRVPTVAEVANHLNLSHITVNYYLTKRFVVRKMLKERGIPFEEHTQSELTQEQVAAAALVMNFADERPVSHKLSSIGVSSAQYYAWLKNPQFKNMVDMMAEENKLNVRPAAIAEFTKKVHAGDWPALKFYLEATGEFAQEAPASDKIIPMLIEVIQKHVQDPATLMAIADDFKSIMQNKTLEYDSPQAIEGSVVDSGILENAKKKLGI